jgi:methionyl-tRNA formyltransferase
MAQSLRVLLLAEEAAGVHALRILATSSHEVVAVMTRGVGSDEATVAGVASRLGYRVWPSRQVKENGFAETVRKAGIDVLLNVHALHVLPADVVNAPRIGSFNLHPGPLPSYAGLNVPSWAIYNGERTHAVTLHWMDAGIDTGPIAYQVDLAIDGSDTGLTLSAKCVRAGLPLVQRLLETAVKGTIPRRPQPDVPRRYYGREVPQDGQLLWTEPAVRIVNFVRACDYLPFTSPWGYPRGYLAGQEISVLKAARTGDGSDVPAGTIGQRAGNDVLVAARDEWVRVRRVQVGPHTFPAAEILRPGDRFVVHPSYGELSRAIA